MNISITTLLLFLSSTAWIAGALAYTNHGVAFSHRSLLHNNPKAESAPEFLRAPQVNYYNLGIGRNQPLVEVAGPTPDNSSQSRHPPPSSVYETTQYLVEHEGIIEREKFQKLTLSIAAAAAVPTKSPTKKAVTTQRQPVLGQRITDDSVLQIFDAHGNHESQQQQQRRSDPTVGTTANVDNNANHNTPPPSTPQSQAQAMGLNMKSHYDLNTAWVEMLIHSERQRAVRTVAAAP